MLLTAPLNSVAVVETLAAAPSAAVPAVATSGVRGAVVDELPIKLAVADRRVALLAMIDPVLPDIGVPTTLFVEHPGFATVQAEAFKRLWETARPLDSRAAHTRQQGGRPGAAICRSRGTGRNGVTGAAVGRCPSLLPTSSRLRLVARDDCHVRGLVQSRRT